MELFKQKTNIDFLSYAPMAFVLSAILLAGSAWVWFERGSDKYGIDFLGGNEILVRIEEPASSEAIAQQLEKDGLSGASVQSFESGSNEYAIRIGLLAGMTAEQVKDKAAATLKSMFGEKFQILQVDSVGAVIGDELKKKALWATALGLIAILLYMAFRFEFSYSLGAVVAMFHDVIVATGVYLLAGHDLNGSALAAALTIVGYSVNDTIVIFDRVREDLRKNPNAEMKVLMNQSMNECLSRTVITSGLTLLAVLALYIFGGGAIQDLSLFLLAGMVSGVYSTVYIAAPVVLMWEKFASRKRRD